MMDNETIKELAESVNGGIIAATKRLERAIMKLKAENEGLKDDCRGYEWALDWFYKRMPTEYGYMLEQQKQALKEKDNG
jgi:hypothetical protein